MRERVVPDASSISAQRIWSGASSVCLKEVAFESDCVIACCASVVNRSMSIVEL